MRYLDGREVAGYLQAKHLKDVRRLKQAYKLNPKLAIVTVQTANEEHVNNVYLRLKQDYGRDIGAEVIIRRTDEDRLRDSIEELNRDTAVQGIVLQLPLKTDSLTEPACQTISPAKDIDGLNETGRLFDSATATAIYWLLTSYNINLPNKDILIIGQGKLVGKPLSKIFTKLNLPFEAMVAEDCDLSRLKEKQVVIAATGRAGLIKSEHLGPRTVVVDAGVSYQDGRLIGDVDPAVYNSRDDLTITPVKGGLGPLTIAVLYENLVRACLQRSRSAER